MSLENSPIVWTLCFAFALFIAYQLLLDYTRDVPLEYLELQSVVDSIRAENELAIYKSTKLDYSSGLRVGLAIRYDHYKLRNGNLCDVWEIMLRILRSDGDRTIRVGNTEVKVAHLNYQVDKLVKYLESVDQVHVSSQKFIASGAVLAIVIACFVSTTTIHVFEKDAMEPQGMVVEENEGEFYLCTGAEKTLFSSIVGDVHEKSTFENDYSPEKDRGIAMRVTTHVNVRVTATTNFTQTNLVSAAASCIKHLPPNLELGPNDRLAVVQTGSGADDITNTVVKMLVAFITHAELSLNWKHETRQIMQWNPTVLCATVDFVKSLPTANSTFEKVLFYHRLYALSRLHFGGMTPSKSYPKLRLVYAHRPLNTGSYTNWNHFRASVCAHVVEELSYFNVAGPVVVSDVYDYRGLPEEVTQQISGFGTIVQTNEAKLVNYNGVEPGDLCIRGYNIGKATTTMANVGEKMIRPDSEGFYSFPVEARWGTDGCLYIMLAH